MKESRRQLGVTQQELADRAGISLGTVRDLEQGRSTHPRPRSLDALADALRLDPTDRASLHRMTRPRESKPMPKSGPVRISVLGPLAVSRSSTPVPLGSGRHRAVLARLAVTPNHPVSRTELIDLLWPEEPPASAPNILQTHVGRLRRILGSGTDGAPGDADVDARRIPPPG